MVSLNSGEYRKIFFHLKFARIVVNRKEEKAEKVPDWILKKPFQMNLVHSGNQIRRKRLILSSAETEVKLLKRIARYECIAKRKRFCAYTLRRSAVHPSPTGIRR